MTRAEPSHTLETIEKGNLVSWICCIDVIVNFAAPMWFTHQAPTRTERNLNMDESLALKGLYHVKPKRAAFCLHSPHTIESQIMDLPVELPFLLRHRGFLAGYCTLIKFTHGEVRRPPCFVFRIQRYDPSTYTVIAWKLPETGKYFKVAWTRPTGFWRGSIRPHPSMCCTEYILCDKMQGAFCPMLCI